VPVYRPTIPVGNHQPVTDMPQLNRTMLAVALLPTVFLIARPATAQSADDARLRNVPDGEWLMYGRDYAHTHYSPLDRIDTGNVSRLGLAWTYEIGTRPGRPETVPVVSEGVMYATGAWSVVFALDARTGEEIWRWDPGIVGGGRAAGGPSFCCGPVNRGVALYDGKVYVGLLDGRLVALDAATGRIVWARQTTAAGEDYAITGAPRVVGGRVIIGNGGAEYGVRGYVTAYDAQSGDEVWRFYTVPGDPASGFESPAMEMAATTWTGEWWTLGGGGTVWDGMAYDAEANLLYIGVGNGSPWSRDYRSPGGGDNLFLASIVALRPETGEYVWHYQTAPGDDWDYTATQNMILADLVIAGQERKVIMQAPKNGFFYVLDRLTGDLISAEIFADHVTWATGIDIESGRPIETPEARYGREGAMIAPGPRGAHNWEPMSFHPGTALVYIPGQNTVRFYQVAAEFEPEPGRFNLGTGPATAGGPASLPEGVSPGFIIAWDPVRQEERWRHDFDRAEHAGTLATGGNLVFGGNTTRFFALHAETGEFLWESEVPAGMATPMTYQLDGRQYVTIAAGSAGPGVGRVFTFTVD
jgi:quinohemoprotein ethanol dehydrogenase